MNYSHLTSVPVFMLCTHTHTKNIDDHMYHSIPNDPIISRLDVEVLWGFKALSIIRAMSWRPHWPLGWGAKSRSIMIMGVPWGVNAILADVLSGEW